MTSKAYYDSDRVQRIGKIATKFASAVQVGDRIEFGMVGDPQYPAEYRSNRPCGVVTRVKNAGTDGASIRVRLDSGRIADIMPHTIDPRRVWEFSEEDFPKVRARERAKAGLDDTPPPTFRAQRVEPGSYEALLAKVDALATKLDEEIRDNRQFSGALVASLNEISGEVYRSNPDSQFCKNFNDSYQTNIHDRPPSKAAPSPFDSDFDDSDHEP
tara:strand:+ start:2292 stop:2933 length:642 start_codon:yes stop_codon:yes gene_type:complete